MEAEKSKKRIFFYNLIKKLVLVGTLFSSDNTPIQSINSNPKVTKPLDVISSEVRQINLFKNELEFLVYQNYSFLEYNNVQETIFYETPSEPPTMLVSSRKHPCINIESLISETYSEIKDKPSYLTKRVLLGIIMKESSSNPDAISKKGAIGLMQLMPGAWIDSGGTSYSKEEMLNPRKNIRAGINYILWIDSYCKRFNPQWENLPEGDKLRLMIASYNGGASRLKKKGWNIDNMPKETRTYIAQIENRYLLDN
ncbi:MAG: lytic transglycosylase domain-containing protein [Nanoarchaeota archaeon]|nr:lytic transglycosylase domain-containing protein [Nanoarchaeota archaeon]